MCVFETTCLFWQLRSLTSTGCSTAQQRRRPKALQRTTFDACQGFSLTRFSGFGIHLAVKHFNEFQCWRTLALARFFARLDDQRLSLPVMSKLSNEHILNNILRFGARLWWCKITLRTSKRIAVST